MAQVFRNTQTSNETTMKTKRFNTPIIFLFLLAATIAPHFHVMGQMTFTASALTQTENFNGVGATLPTGYQIGGASTITTASSLTSGSTGAAYKFMNGTDYAIGILNSGSYTSGKTITAALVNNTGYTIAGFNVSFNYEKYRSGSRAWTFALTGSAGTVTGGGLAFSADAGNTVSSFPPLQTSSTATVTGLTLASGSTYTLTWTLNGTGGSTNGQALGIDDLVVTAILAPTLTSTLMTSYGNVCINTTAPVKMFTLTGTNLTNQSILLANNIGATIPGYTFSTDGVNFSPAPLTLTQPGGSYAQDIYVKFTPVAVQSYSANIRFTGGGISSFYNVNVPVPTRGVFSVPTVTIGTNDVIGELDATISGMITDTGCSALTSYGIEYSVTSGFVNGTGIQVTSSDQNGTNFTAYLDGLTSNTTYYYHVFAINAGGVGYSAEASFVTIVGLPVSWLYFEGMAKDKNNLLQWATATEENTLVFQIEKSTNGYDYQLIGAVEASHSSATEKRYSFADNAIGEVAYYRVKQLDVNGNFAYSTAVRVNRQTEVLRSVTLYPVPVTGSLSVSWEGAYYKASVYNRLGRLVKEVALDGSERHLQLSTSAFAPDFYVLEMKSYEGDPVVKKFLVIE